MKCIKCNEEASAICKFCGRAVCVKHVQTSLFASGYSAKTGAWNMNDNAIRVEDAVYCGVCHPEYKMTS